MSGTQVADPLIGTLIDGRYRVQARRARSGMASVYLAQDERLERTVALKIVHPGRADQAEFVHRFIEEARAIARLTHPNIVAAYDQGRHDHLPYLVTEYVRGRTLREILRTRSRLTPAEALVIMEQLLAALATAHRTGLVHRDVKPENVLVAETPSSGPDNLVDGVVKVTDFGVARAMEASGATAEHGGMLAAVAYTAPELVRTGYADPRSDVYSAGIVLFEMLTGQVPYHGGPAAEVAWRHVDEDVPPPSRYLPDLPSVVDDLVVRATRRDPAGRPSDAGVLLQEVRAAREQVSVTTPPPQPASTAADATMVLAAVPAAERPAWARLPSTRATKAAKAATGGRRRTHGPANQPAAPPAQRPADTGRTTRLPLLLISGAVALALLLAAGGWWFAIGRWQPVPTLVGLPEAEAVASVEARGLRVEFAESQYDQQVAAGHVLAQDPEQRAPKGGTVTLTLSLGPEQRPMPNLVGVEHDVAVQQLEALGIEVLEGDPAYSDTVPAGRVLATDPAAGEEINAGDPVTLTVSQGRAPITVPLLIGVHVDQARHQLAQLGLEPVIQEVQDTRPKGEVFGQDPSPGAGAEPGQQVTLEVSTGPPGSPVPDFKGKKCKEASEELTKSGFAVVIFGSPGGRVRNQSPGPGEPQPPGTEVTLICF